MAGRSIDRHVPRRRWRGLDAATRRCVPALIVRVTGDLDAEIVAPARTGIAPGASADLDLWIANLGKAEWGYPSINDPENPGSKVPATSATVSGQWVATDTAPESIAAAAAASKVTGKPAGRPGAGRRRGLDPST